MNGAGKSGNHGGMVDEAFDRAAREVGYNHAETYTREDNRFWDGTDGAHPAWFRGNDRGVQATAQALKKITETGEHKGVFGCSELESAAQAILALRKQPLEAALPAHKAGLYLTHNKHKGYHETAQQYLDGLMDGDIDPDTRRQCIEADSIWELQWYPETSAGFYTVYGPTLESVLSAAKEMK